MPLSGLSLGGSSKVSLQKEKTFQLAKAVDINTRKLRLPEATWHGQKRTRKQGCQQWLDGIVDSVMLEVVVGLVIAADLILTILTFTMPEDDAESTAVFAVGAIFLIVLMGDVALRVGKFRLVFFHRPLNWLEFIVAVAGCVMLVFEGVERADCGGPCNSNRSTTGGGTSLGRSIRPTIKAWRIVRTMMQLTNSRGGLHKQLDRQTDRFFGRLCRLYLNDFFLIPQQNVYMKPSAGMLHAEKAQIRSSAFKGLHLPLTISCGIIDLIHVHVNLGDKHSSSDHDEDDDSNHKMLVVIENALIVVGPGHHQEAPEPPWTFESVFAAKKKLIELLTRRLEASAKQQVKNTAGPDSKKKKGGGLVGKALKARVKSHMEEVLARGVHISIQNLEIRYEDPSAQLSPNNRTAVVGGMRIGYITLRAAGATEDDELQQETEEDFRVKGRWRCDAEALHWYSPQQTDDLTSPKSARRFRQKRKLSQGVRMAVTADRICAFWDMNNAEEAKPRDAGYSVASGYTAKLAEGSGVDIEEFLDIHAMVRRRERFRLALAKEVERRMVSSVGGCVAREMARRLRDRVAAHKYIVMPFGGSVHAVVRPPSSEAGGRSPIGTVGGRWQPHVDVSVVVNLVSMAPDIKQAASIAWLADYVKRWLADERRFQWHVPPQGCGRKRMSMAFARWIYALRTILHSIDPNHSWHCLTWIGLQRRCSARVAYYNELVALPPLDQDTIGILQVALPLPDCLSVRKEAALVVAFRQKKRRKPSKAAEVVRQLTHRIKDGGLGIMESGDASRSSGIIDMEQGDQTCSVNMGGSSMNLNSPPGSPSGSAAAAEKQRNSGKNLFRPGELAVQVHVWISTAKMGALSPEAYKQAPRRPIMLGQASEIEVTAVVRCPRKVWMRYGPPEASATACAQGQTPLGMVVECGVSSVSAIFYGAPSSAWKLRRAFFCGGGGLGPRGGRPQDDKNNFAPGEKSVGKGARSSYGAKGNNVERALLEAGIRVRLADMGVLEAKGSWFVMPKHLWVFAACVPPVEVHVLKPLIQALLRTVKPPKQPPPSVLAAQAAAQAVAQAEGRLSYASSGTGSVKSWIMAAHGKGKFGTGRFTRQLTRDVWNSESASCLDPNFWSFVVSLSRMRATRDKIDRKKRLNEKVTGAAGFLKGGLLQGSILLMGGLRADLIEPSTEETWILQAVHVPAGTAQVSRGGFPPDMKAGFRPLASPPGTSGGLTQAEDGWWFETEAQARAAQERLRETPEQQPGWLSSDRGTSDFEIDVSCAGMDAVEDAPQAGRSPSVPPRLAGAPDVSAWQTSLARSLRYKPRESDKGLLQTSFLHLPRSPRPGKSPRSSRSPGASRKSRVKPLTTPALCCLDLSVAIATGIPAKSELGSPSPVTKQQQTTGSARTPSREPSWSQAFESEWQLPRRSWEPPPAMDGDYGDIDIWLESLSPEEIGLPAPSKAEDLWASMGCVRIPPSTALTF